MTPDQAAREILPKYFSKRTRGDRVAAIKDICARADCRIPEAMAALNTALSNSESSSSNIGKKRKKRR